MQQLYTLNGKPLATIDGEIKNTSTPAAPLPAASPATRSAATHKPECGEVGHTGEHGAIGQNAA